MDLSIVPKNLQHVTHSGILVAAMELVHCPEKFYLIYEQRLELLQGFSLTTKVTQQLTCL